MSDAAPETELTLHAPPPGWSDLPPGWKPLAWAGVGLAVPAHWDLGRFAGTIKQGGLRVDDAQRIVAQVKWWSTGGPISLERTAERQRKAGGAAKRGQPRLDLELAPEPGLPLPRTGRAAAYTLTGAAHHETLVLWQHASERRAALFRFLGNAELLPRPLLTQLLRTLRLDDANEPLNWAALDWGLQSPAGWVLQKAALASGVCYIRFGQRRRQIALRRFSAASALLGQPDDPTSLADWARAVYAEASFDMKYALQRDESRRRVTLTARRRWWTLPRWRGLIPHHQVWPRWIEIRHDPEVDKIYCFELRRLDADSRTALAQLQAGLRMTLPAEVVLPTLTADQSRSRSLLATITRPAAVEEESLGPRRVRLCYQTTSPPRLRVLRLLAAQPVGGVRQTRRLELDPLGATLWHACAAEPRVVDLVELLMRQHQISYREAEMSVTDYVRRLGQRRLLALKLPE